MSEEFDEMQERYADNGEASLYSLFPWVEQMGLGEEIRGWLIDGLEGSALLAALRKTPQYQQMFPWIRRSDGTLRMNEAQYLQTSARYRELFRQYGFEEPRDPMQLGSFFDGEVSADELKERFEKYREIERAGRPAREAFYVYAGIKLSVDDHYRAVVEPERWEAMQEEYNVRVASNPLDYETWTQRATEVGLQRVVDSLKSLEKQGVVTGTAIERVRGINPEFASQMMDTLYTGGDVEAGDYIGSLDELMATFEEAMIGGASSAAGLGLPSKDRVAELRAAGVQRSQALRRYSEFGAQASRVTAATDRYFGQGFSGRDFEEAEWLGNADARRTMESAIAQEEALGKASGGVNIQQGEYGFTQSGFDPRRR